MSLRYLYILFMFLLLFVGVSHSKGALPHLDEQWGTSDDSATIYPELDGRSVKIGLVELCQPDSPDQPGFNFMPNLNHQSLAGVNLQEVHYYRNKHRPVRYSAHATMIAGILFGDDTQANIFGLDQLAFRGMIPRAALSVYETNWFIYKRILPTSPSLDEDILTISWGTDANDVMTQWWQRGIDALVVRNQCVVVAGCGNGTDQFSSITKPSSAYNVIAVGAASGLGVFPHTVKFTGPPRRETSNFGPTEDGRAKPDCIAPGVHVAPDTLRNDQYHTPQDGESYSSFAAPVVAGLAGLLIDAARKTGFEDADDPRLIKALILNGANKLTGWHKGEVRLQDDSFVPFDYAQGAGLVDVANSLDQLLAGRFNPQAPENTGWDLTEIALESKDASSAKIYFLPEPLEPNEQLKATLVWYRHYQQDSVFRPLPLAHLQLELWQVNEQGQLQILLDQSISSIDNLQHIYYTSDQKQKVALVLRAGENPSPHATHETAAVAFTTSDQNWPGDVLAGDLNVDGVVDQQDAHLLLSGIKHLSERNESDSQNDPVAQNGDINHNGIIDTEDVIDLFHELNHQSNWHNSP